MVSAVMQFQPVPAADVELAPLAPVATENGSAGVSPVCGEDDDGANRSLSDATAFIAPAAAPAASMYITLFLTLRRNTRRPAPAQRSASGVPRGEPAKTCIIAGFSD